MKITSRALMHVSFWTMIVSKFMLLVCQESGRLPVVYLPVWVAHIFSIGKLPSLPELHHLAIPGPREVKVIQTVAKKACFRTWFRTASIESRYSDSGEDCKPMLSVWSVGWVGRLQTCSAPLQWVYDLLVRLVGYKPAVLHYSEYMICLLGW